MAATPAKLIQDWVRSHQRPSYPEFFQNPPRWPHRVIQAPPPAPPPVVPTDCSMCATRGVRSQMAWIEPGFFDCRKCGFRLHPK